MSVKISELPAATALTGTESFPVVQAGETRQATIAGLLIDASKNGFINRTDSIISFVDGTRTLTIAPAVTSFQFYSNGTQYTKTVAQTVTITDTEGQWFIYFNDSGVLTSTQTFTELLITQYAFVAIVYWDATNNAAIFLGDERHGCLMDSQTHLYLHNTHGSAIDYPMGLAITDIVADGSGDVANTAQVGVSGGGMWDEDIEHVIATIAAPASLPCFYLLGTGQWRRKTAAAYPLLYGITGTRANYNLLTTGTWSVEEVASGQYTLSHLFATNDPNQPVIVIAGQADYSTITQARTNALTELQNLNTIGLPSQEFIAIATLIFQTRNTYSNVPKSRIRSTDAGDDYVDWRNTRIGGSGNAATVGWGNITGTLASQLDLQTALNGKSDTSHTHTATAISNTPAGNIVAVTVQAALDELDSEKAATSHTHTGTYEPALGNPASNGQVLSSTTAGVRSWVSGGGSPGLVLLATASASNVAYVDFTGIDDTYDEYEVHIQNAIPATDNVAFYLRTSSNSGSSFDSGASDYAYALGGGGINYMGFAPDYSSAKSAIVLYSFIGNATNETGCSFTVNIIRPSSTQYASFKSIGTCITSDGNLWIVIGAGRRLTASAVNAIRFLFSSGNIASGEFKLYGLKKSL